MATLIDWTQIDRQLDEIYRSRRGEAGWPPLSLLKGMLLAMWHDLSDVKLEEALADRASFRRFCGFTASEPTPERTAFVRFRAELVKRGLDRSLFKGITDQLKAKRMVVRTGTLVDAALISSASIHQDGEARWAGHRRRKPVHGYKAHVATDQDAVLIEAVEVTTANVQDAALLSTPAATASNSSSPVAACRSPCKPQRGVGRQRLIASRHTTRRFGTYAAGSRRSSGQRSGVMGYAGCGGSVWPRLACKSSSRRFI